MAIYSPPGVMLNNCLKFGLFWGRLFKFGIVYKKSVPKEGSQCIYLSAILIDSVFRIGNKYYFHAFLEECKYVVKEKEMPKYITDDIEISSHDSADSDKEDSNEESSDDSDKENSNEESNSEEAI